MRVGDLLARLRKLESQIVLAEVAGTDTKNRVLADDAQRPLPILQPIFERFGSFREDLHVETSPQCGHGEKRDEHD